MFLALTSLTLSIITSCFSDIPPPDLIQQGNDETPFYADFKIVIPLIVLVIGIIVTAIGAVLCLRHRK